MRKIVLYKEYGGFYIPNKFAYDYIFDNNLDLEDVYDLELYFKEHNINVRENKEFVEYMKNYPSFKVVEIPDNYHYVIVEYDGYENIYYSESKIESDSEWNNYYE